MSASKCTPEKIEQIRSLREIRTSWPKISKAVGVSVTAMDLWRKPGSKLYRKAFADMVKEAQEYYISRKIQCDKKLIERVLPLLNNKALAKTIKEVLNRFDPGKTNNG